MTRSRKIGEVKIYIDENGDIRYNLPFGFGADRFIQWNLDYENEIEAFKMERFSKIEVGKLSLKGIA